MNISLLHITAKVSGRKISARCRAGPGKDHIISCRAERACRGKSSSGGSKTSTEFFPNGETALVVVIPYVAFPRALSSLTLALPRARHVLQRIRFGSLALNTVPLEEDVAPRSGLLRMNVVVGATDVP